MHIRQIFTLTRLALQCCCCNSYYSGITKEISYRKQQLGNLLRFIEENSPAIQKALYDDLHKHSLETNIGEISSVVDEIKYMVKVYHEDHTTIAHHYVFTTSEKNIDRLSKPTSTKKRFMMNAMDKTYIRKEPKGVVAVLGKFWFALFFLKHHLNLLVAFVGAWNYPVCSINE